jgi:5-(carboxyamino)imidazole ribonucleotide mutase/phosphoribosylaminoimidazole-succinocarboxamide synthase
MSKPLVVILMGSIVDEPHCQKIAESAQGFGLDVVMRVGSAHKTGKHVIEILDSYEKDPRSKVYITVAGRSNALSGFVDGVVSAPVIACPPASNTFAGADIYSSLRMPSGVSPAVVLEPENAALLAARIFALQDDEVRKNVAAYKRRQMEKVIDGDVQLRSRYSQSE